MDDSRLAGVIRIVATAALLVGTLGDQSASDAGAVKLLRDSMFAAQSVSYVGEVETVNFGQKHANATIVRVEHRAPSQTRRTFLAPDAIFGDYVVTTADRSYFFDLRHTRVTITREPPVDDVALTQSDLDRILSNYRVVMSDATVIAGRLTQSVILVNAYTGERTLRLWVDEETHLAMRREEYRSNGSVEMASRFEDLRYTAALPDQLFVTKIPDGFTTIEGPDFGGKQALSEAIAEAGFAPITPKDLPRGFSLVGGHVDTVSGIKTLHLIYSDGLTMLSLFENARGAAVDFGAMRPQTVWFEGHDAQVVDDGSTTLLAWREHGLHFALVADLTQPQVIAIARSIVP